MIEWAAEARFERVGAFRVGSGLATMNWRDACRPPKPFWEKLGLAVVGTGPRARDWAQVRAEMENEVTLAREQNKDLWKLERFPQYIREFESSGLPFSEFDAQYSLVREVCR